MLIHAMVCCDVDLSYSRDANSRITGIVDGVDANESRDFTYDPLGRLVAARGPWGQATYSYDALNNIRAKTLGSATVEMAYDGTNRLSRYRDSRDGNVWRNYSYDARGNVIYNGRIAFTHDAANQPVTMTGQGTGGTLDGDFAYDAHLKRVKQEIDGEIIYSFYSRSGRIEYRYNRTDKAKNQDIITVGGMAVARISGAGETYEETFLHPDHLGSPVAATDSGGNIKWRESYTPFGEKLVNPNGNRDSIGYTGHIDDAATGLTYMQARYYDPVTARFLSTDPVGFVESGGDPAYFNRYAYVYNDPVNFWDPFGLAVVVAMEKYGVHAYVRITDTDTGQSTISRAGPRDAMSDNRGSSGSSSNATGGTRGSSGGVGPITATVDPAAESIDTRVPQEQDMEVTVIGETTLGDDVSYDDAVASAENFAEKVNEAEVPYRLTTQNSNSYASTQYEQLTGEEAPQGEGFLPGYDNDLCSSGVECD